MSELALKSVRNQMASFVRDAVLDGRVIDVLRLETGFVPAETELWDFKRQVPDDARSWGRTVLRVVSFYNSYGGYLIYGVEEVEKDQIFHPLRGCRCSLDIQHLRQAIETYTGETIDVAFREVGAEFGDAQCNIGLLHVPKRPVSRPPLFFGRNGPESAPGKPLFTTQQVYFRKLAECVPAQSKDNFVFIFGNRDNPSLWAVDAPESISPPLSIQNTLPDKNLICPDFVGRLSIINSLWRWLGDEFAHVKLLVGDGGKGKTSIAYAFAREVCMNAANGFQKVIWLTAKSRRFVGEIDDYVPMPQRHFFDTESLLRALSSELAILREEVEGASPVLLKKTLRRSLLQFPCLIVVDDVDSADADEQKEILNTTMQLASSSNRFLITTRMNFAFGKDLAITVGGLEPSEFSRYASQLEVKFGTPALNHAQIDRLRVATDGSPLFAESIFRLLKRGMRFDAALKEWKGKLGTEVRNAALKKEVDTLKPESRRVLLICALMEQVSFAELKQLTGYIDDRLHQCLEELQALFLLSTPTIIKNEPRFGVAENTGLLVLENAKSIVADPSAIERKVRTLRGTSTRASKNRTVGLAIRQAMALLQNNRHKDALATAEAALKSVRQNSDLISTRAICLLAKNRADGDRVSLDSARKAFRASYELGNRKPRMFELWYQSEELSEDWAGAVDVATLVLREKVEERVDWYRRKVSGLLRLAQAKKGTSVDAVVDDLNQAAEDVRQALALSRGEKHDALQNLLLNIYDHTYDAAHATRPNIPDLKFLFDILVKNSDRGDSRFINALRLNDVIERIVPLLPPPNRMSVSQRNLLDQMLREGEPVLKRIDSTSTTAKQLIGIEESWRRLRASFMDSPTKGADGTGTTRPERSA
jgi:NB-ARC domain